MRAFGKFAAFIYTLLISRKTTSESIFVFRMERKLWRAKYEKRAILDHLLTLEGYWSVPPSDHEESGSETVTDGAESLDGQRIENLSSKMLPSAVVSNSEVQNFSQ